MKTRNSKEEHILRHYIRKKILEVIQERKHKECMLRKYIQKALLRESSEDKKFSKYFGINILNHEVLIQIKDDIHMKTKSLGDNSEFVEYFKKYIIMYLEDLLATSFDILDIENEISQIKGVLRENQVRIDIKPESPEESPIDTELFGNEGEEELRDDEETKEKEEKIRITTTPTHNLETSEERKTKRSEMELKGGGQQDAKNQALDLMTDIDDIIIDGYDKISDDLNRDLFIRYLAINILLHIDKAHNEMKEEPKDVRVPGYEEERRDLESRLNSEEPDMEPDMEPPPESLEGI